MRAPGSSARNLARNLVGRLVIALCVAALVLARPASGSPATLVDIATDTTDPSNLADTEPSIAVNPLNPMDLAVVTFSESWGPTAMAPVWRSNNGGANWTKVFQIPQPPSGFPGPGDQKIAFDAAGALYVAELGIGAPPMDYVYRQTGAASAPLTVGAAYGDDQPHLDVDRSAAGACLNRLYSPWLNFGLAPPRSTVSYSTTGGAAMTGAAAGVSTFPNRTTRIALSPTGRAYVVFKTREPGSTVTGFENAHFIVKRSDDCGVTWTGLGTAGVSIHGSAAVQTFFTNCFGNPTFNCTANPGKVARARSSDAWIAVDPGDEDVFVTYVRRDVSGFGQVYVARSTNQGVTWTPARVTDGTRHSAYPEIAVTDNGAVGVLYIDFELSGTTPIYRHRFARSFNNGASWTNQTLQSMDPGPITNAASGFLWGDYEGLTAWGNTFYGVFTGQSVGRTTLQLDPIFFSETGVQIRLDLCTRFPQLCRPAGLQPGTIILRCDVKACVLKDPIPKNCLVKFNCPGCPPVGLCPPWYTVFFDGLDPAVWTIGLFDRKGDPVPFRQFRAKTGTIVTFRPSKESFVEKQIADFELVFQMTPRGQLGVEYKIRTRLEQSNRPYSPEKSK